MSAPQIGDRVASAVTGGPLRVGTVEKLHPKSGSLTLRTDEGRAHVVTARLALVITCHKPVSLTVAELDLMPADSVVYDASGDPWTKDDLDHWQWGGGLLTDPPGRLIAVHGPIWKERPL
jgi:hypothetical protein